MFRQPHPGHAQGYLTPFRLDTTTTSAQATPGTDHSWASQHEAWDNGKMDQWVQAKGPYTMGYFTQADIPFQWALARAFTICDNYHCSVLGPTNPNRLYMWTGMIDPRGAGGGPVIDDTPAYNNVILSWTTYPERLQRAGLSWQVYQEEDNYDDNALAWFRQFARAPVSSPLWQRGMRKTPGGLVRDRRPGGPAATGVLAGRADRLDHTSLIRVIEKRFGVPEPNISAFRRRICGDFTSALRFSGPPADYPRSPEAITLAAADAGLLTAQQEVFANPAPLVPVTNEPVPSQ